MANSTNTFGSDMSNFGDLFNTTQMSATARPATKPIADPLDQLHRDPLAQLRQEQLNRLQIRMQQQQHQLQRPLQQQLLQQQAAAAAVRVAPTPTMSHGINSSNYNANPLQPEPAELPTTIDLSQLSTSPGQQKPKPSSPKYNLGQGYTIQIKDDLSAFNNGRAWYCCLIEKKIADGRVYKSRYPLGILKALAKGLEEMNAFAVLHDTNL